MDGMKDLESALNVELGRDFPDARLGHKRVNDGAERMSVPGADGLIHERLEKAAAALEDLEKQLAELSVRLAGNIDKAIETAEHLAGPKAKGGTFGEMRVSIGVIEAATRRLAASVAHIRQAM